MSTPAPARDRETIEPNKASAPPAAPKRANPLAGDLLRHKGLARFVRSRWFPGIFQVPVAAVFGLVGYQLLAGPSTARDNAGTALMWVLWWPIIPIVFVLLGRFWCAVCPFALVSDLVQKLVGLERPVPAFLKKYGIWIIDALFLAITWADHVWGIVESPWGSGILLLLLTTGVIVSGALWQRRAFCRYLCFLGGLAGNYSRTSMVELRATPEVCKTCTSRAACFNGTDSVPSCPLTTFARTMEDNANCNLCGNCVKSCPNGSLTLTLRKPTSELWSIRKPHLEGSFLAMAIMGIVLIQNVTMLSVWSDLLDWIAATTEITSYPVIFTVAFAVAVAVPVGLLVAAAAVAKQVSGVDILTGVARFGYAFIPLDVAGHIAHNMFHLLAEGKSVVTTLVVLFGGAPAEGSAALLSTGTIQILQYVVLAIGIAATGYAVHRIARSYHGTGRRYLATVAPMLTVVAVLSVLNLWLFALPMAHRM